MVVVGFSATSHGLCYCKQAERACKFDSRDGDVKIARLLAKK